MVAMITQKGVLPVGIERDGKVHREFEVRPLMVKDSVEMGDEREPQELNNPYAVGLFLTAKQLIRIGDISPVSAELLAGLYEVDLGAISAAREKLTERLRSFNSEKGSEGAEGDAPSGDAKGAA